MKVVLASGLTAPHSARHEEMIRILHALSTQEGWEFTTVLRESVRHYDWARRLMDDQIEVVFAGDTPRRAYEGMTRVLSSSPGGVVIHTHLTTFDVPAALARHRWASTSVLLWHVHSRLVPGPWFWARNMVKFSTVGRSVDAILCVNPLLVGQLVRRGAPADRVRFFPNPVHTLPPATPAERRAARAALGIDQSSIVLLHFGWHWHTKGGDLYLGAVRRLTDMGSKVAAITVHGGSDAVADIGRWKLDRIVRVQPPVEDVRALYAAADVFVASSRAEGAPASIAEALGVGVPVVATDIPGHVLECHNLAACRIVSPDPIAIAGGIRDLLSRSQEQAAVEQEQTYAELAGRMNRTAWCARLVDLYRALAISRMQVNGERGWGSV